MFNYKKNLKKQPVLLGRIGEKEFYAIWYLGEYHIARALGRNKEVFLHSLDGYETVQICRKEFRKTKEEQNGRL